MSIFGANLQNRRHVQPHTAMRDIERLGKHLFGLACLCLGAYVYLLFVC